MYPKTLYNPGIDQLIEGNFGCAMVFTSGPSLKCINQHLCLKYLKCTNPFKIKERLVSNVLKNRKLPLIIQT